MTILIFSTQKVLLGNSASRWGAATQGDAVLVSETPCGNVSGEVTRIVTTAFKDALLLDNYESSELVELAAVELGLKHRVKAVLAFSELDILRAARVRRQLGLQGQSPEEALFFRDKAIMKRRAWERGVDVPRFAAITCPEDLVGFTSATGYPVVVKPVDGRGCLGVSVLNSDVDTAVFLSSGVSGLSHYTVEEFISGDMYRVDGLWIGEQEIVIHVGRYTKDCLAFTGGEPICTYGLDPDNPLLSRIKSFTRFLLNQALPFPPTSLFHLQLFHTPKNRLVLCEVACRLGGGLINEEVRLATGVDMKAAFISANLSDSNTTRSSEHDRPTARLIIPPRHGVLREIPQACDTDWVDIYRPYGEPSRRYDGASMTNKEICAFVFTGDDERHLALRATELCRWFDATCVWAE